MPCIDGLVLAVATANKQTFIAPADFRRAVQATDDGTVVFSRIEWPDKATRDAGMEKAMKDPRLQPDVNPMPFDGMRLIHGGFEPVVGLGTKH